MKHNSRFILSVLAFGYAFLYIGILMGLSILIFSRRDFV